MQSRSVSHARGIDVSRWQGSIDWKQVREAGISFVFIKASQGSALEDPKFVENAQGAKAAGLLIGAYHFLAAASVVGARQEAKHFVETMKKAGPLAWFDLPPALDYENNPAGISRAAINQVAAAFLEEVERLTGRQPILYTGNAFAANFDESLGKYDLWIARYSETRVPDDRPAWTTWTFWQYTDAGRINGITGKVDLNVYAGTLPDLKAYASRGSREDGAADPPEGTRDVSPWAEASWREAVENGYLDDARPGAPMTREEAAVLVHRLLRELRQLIEDQERRIESLEREPDII
ncbi:hypothetical protein BBD41_05595 [Paenibacillus ihbetae]|uniref:Lysozyme n=1 Tax=Paenibacillus ihbetae TaxID=1870820 RepID=A0A1B2DWM8_9BACL|nr:glycoside hydrolase family 25 protein [Paenibacillus ihbetae]ANY72105.1 hypothetical protein BBD41_05595 [Paenibacillus ihbetae]